MSYLRTRHRGLGAFEIGLPGGTGTGVQVDYRVTSSPAAQAEAGVRQADAQMLTHVTAGQNVGTVAPTVPYLGLDASGYVFGGAEPAVTRSPYADAVTDPRGGGFPSTPGDPFAQPPQAPTDIPSGVDDAAARIDSAQTSSGEPMVTTVRPNGARNGFRLPQLKTWQWIGIGAAVIGGVLLLTSMRRRG